MRVATRTYRIFVNMHTRCGNANSSHYDRYGGRGIKVCERWATFATFLSDMGECPPGLELDRIDNDKGYSPENCRWATRKQQTNNRSTSNLVEINGKTMTVAEWSEQPGAVRARTVYARLAAGWSAERAVFQKIKEPAVAA